MITDQDVEVVIQDWPKEWRVPIDEEMDQGNGGGDAQDNQLYESDEEEEDNDEDSDKNDSEDT